jgi:hypothetical protein
MTRLTVLVRAVAATLLATAVGAPPAAASVPCSKTAIAKLITHDRFESITTVLCADLDGNGTRDTAWTLGSGGSGGDIEWGIVYERGAKRHIAHFTGHTHYLKPRIKGRRLLIDSPRYKPSDPNCCPSLGTRTESATWNGKRFVKRLVAVRPP